MLLTLMFLSVLKSSVADRKAELYPEKVCGFKTGDMIYIDGLNATGKVNYIGIVTAYPERSSMDIIIKNENGTFTILKSVKMNLCKKVENR